MRKIAIILIAFLTACGSDDYLPKPKGYFRIDLPAKKYQELVSDYPFGFRYSTSSKVVVYNPDSVWLNIFYPQLKGTIYLTYKPVKNNLYKLTEQTRTFAFKHDIKADAIGETRYDNAGKNVYGILYDIKGNTASSFNFYLTDSVHHFISGALYFDSKPNKDSLAPVIEYIKSDIDTLIESFEWKNKK